MIRRKQVCIIGAGVSGLAAAKAFAARGHQITIVERSGDLGGVWEPSRSYPEVQTQSPKDLYRYTDKAMPDSYPEWPKGPQVHAYLTGYARDHDLLRAIRFNTTVLQMNRRTDLRRAGGSICAGRTAGPATKTSTLSLFVRGSSMSRRRSNCPARSRSRRRAGASCTRPSTTIQRSPKEQRSSCSAAQNRLPTLR